MIKDCSAQGTVLLKLTTADTKHRPIAELLEVPLINVARSINELSSSFAVDEHRTTRPSRLQQVRDGQFDVVPFVRQLRSGHGPLPGTGTDCWWTTGIDHTVVQLLDHTEAYRDRQQGDHAIQHLNAKVSRTVELHIEIYNQPVFAARCYV